MKLAQAEFDKWWLGNRWKAQQWYIDAVTEAAFKAGFNAGRRSKRKKKS